MFKKTKNRYRHVGIINHKPKFSQRLVNGPGDRVLDVVDPARSKTGGDIWSPDGGVASVTALSRAEGPTAKSGFSTDADRRLTDLHHSPTGQKRRRQRVDLKKKHENM